MRILGLVLAMMVVAAPVLADKRPAKGAKGLDVYAGKLVISPDTPPTVADELVAFLKANITKDASYDLIKGPPWPFHLVAVLAKDQKQVTLVVADKDDKKLTPLISIDLVPAHRLVIAHSEATVAAGFAARKTYVVRLLAGKTVLAKSELTLRD